MPCACSLLALAICVSRSFTSFVPTTIVRSDPSTSLQSVTARLARTVDSSIIAAVSRAACALRCASVRTSSATTANPLPASPARAASTAALSAKRFVWKAISSMTLSTLPIESLDCLIAPIASVIRAIPSWHEFAFSRAASLRVTAEVQFSALRSVMEDISSRLAEICCKLAACSLAPLATD